MHLPRGFAFLFLTWLALAKIWRAFFNVTLEHIGSVDKERSSGFYNVSQDEETMPIETS